MCSPPHIYSSSNHSNSKECREGALNEGSCQSPARRGPLAPSDGGCGKSSLTVARHEPPYVYCPSRWRCPGSAWCNLKQLCWICEMTWPGILARLSAVFLIICDVLLPATHYYWKNLGLNHHFIIIEKCKH